MCEPCEKLIKHDRGSLSYARTNERSEISPMGWHAREKLIQASRHYARPACENAHPYSKFEQARVQVKRDFERSLAHGNIFKLIF